MTVPKGYRKWNEDNPPKEGRAIKCAMYYNGNDPPLFHEYPMPFRFVPGVRPVFVDSPSGSEDVLVQLRPGVSMTHWKYYQQSDDPQGVYLKGELPPKQEHNQHTIGVPAPEG